MDDLIFRTHPQLWDDLFGQVTTAEEAAEQARQQAAWVEIAMAECGTISHCRSRKVPAPTIPASQQLELESQIRTRWNEPGGDLYSSWPDCLVDPYSPIDVGEGGWAYTSYREPLQPGLPSLWIEAPASMSAEQSEVIVDWILDAAACDPAATILPPESAAPRLYRQRRERGIRRHSSTRRRRVDDAERRQCHRRTHRRARNLRAAVPR